MRAFALNQSEAFGCARGAENVEANGTRYLQGSDAYSAAGSVDQDGFAGASFTLVVDRVIGSCVWNENASALREGNAFRQTVYLRLKREGVFGIGAGKASFDVNAVARLYAGDT